MLKLRKETVAGSLALVMLAACISGCGSMDVPDHTTATQLETSTMGVTDPLILGTGGFTEPTLGIPLYCQTEQIRLPSYDAGWINRFAGAYGSFATAENPGELEAVFDAVSGMGKNVAVPESYSENFFAQYRLVLIPMQSSSGSVTYEVLISNNGALTTISLDAQMPEVGTADMADWLVLVPLERNAYPEEIQIELVSDQKAPNDPGLNASDK